ncbi:MAG: LysR substrate-binding domain-containing protein, partial [Pseudomonadota bacterium]
EELDLIVGITSELTGFAPQLDFVELAAQLGRAYVRAGHPVLAKGSVDRADLDAYGLAASHYAPSVLTQFAETFGYVSAEDLPVGVNSENTDLLCDLTANSDFVLLSTRECTRHATADGSLVEIKMELATEAEWTVASRRGRLQHPQAAALVQVLRHVVMDAGGAAPKTGHEFAPLLA